MLPIFGKNMNNQKVLRREYFTSKPVACLKSVPYFVPNSSDTTLIFGLRWINQQAESFVPNPVRGRRVWHSFDFKHSPMRLLYRIFRTRHKFLSDMIECFEPRILIIELVCEKHALNAHGA